MELHRETFASGVALPLQGYNAEGALGLHLHLLAALLHGHNIHMAGEAIELEQAVTEALPAVVKMRAWGDGNNRPLGERVVDAQLSVGVGVGFKGEEPAIAAAEGATAEHH